MSVVKLYYSGGTYGNWELNPGRLLKLDNIAAYLATKTALTKNTFQYVKNDLEITIKLDLSQSIANPKVVETFKYCSIQNTGEQIHYYFIKKPRWRSLNCVEFELVLDVLNTFVEGTDYVFKKNTHIIREHKDRFKRCNYVFRIQYTIASQSDNQIVEGDEVTLADNETPLEPAYTGKVIEISYGTPSYIYVMITEVNVDFFSQWIYELEKLLISSSGEWIVCSSSSETLISNEWYRVIDYIPEGINPALMRLNDNETNLEDISSLQDDWYLLYRNHDTPDPDDPTQVVDTYLIPGENHVIIHDSMSYGRLSPEMLTSDQYYMVKQTQPGRLDLMTTEAGDNLGVYAVGMPFEAYFCIHKNAEDLIIIDLYMTEDYNSLPVLLKKSWATKVLTLNIVPMAYSKVSSLPSTTSITDWRNAWSGGEAGSWNNGSQTALTNNIRNLDRTDSRNIKLIKLPYCPYDFTITGNKIDLSHDSNWSLEKVPQSGNDCYAFRLDPNAHIKLKHTLKGYQPFNLLKIDEGLTPALNDLRNMALLDSKLYGSEFLSPTYYYDSFAFKFELEKCDLDYYISSGIDDDGETIEFTMTQTINSKFMFKWADYKMKMNRSNYPKVLTIARNNEEVLYNVPYLNYVRTGFNYDVKAKNLKVQAMEMGIALSTGASMMSLATKPLPLAIAGIVGEVSSVAQSVKNTIISNISAQNSIDEKLESTNKQAISVAGSDDVDLMSEYSGNRMRFTIYEPNPVMKASLNDLFFYAGYRSDRMGIPNHINRVNFDYLECDASLESLRSIPNDCLTELINCFKSGVTYLHANAMIGYDFEQKYENWERFIFD